MSTCKYCDAEIEWEDRTPLNMDGSRHTCQKKTAQPRACRYECGSMLLWNDNQKAYFDVNTNLTHTKEQCEEAKARLAQKNDHGNELPPHNTFSNVTVEDKKDFVDHTAAGIPKIITIVGESAEEMDDLANSWLKKEASRIRFKGGQRAYRSHDDKHEITLYYEEISK